MSPPRIHPARGMGVGRQLIERLLTQAVGAGFRRCYLETMRDMQAARRLYERVGFTPLTGPLGNTGHFGCDSWYARAL